MGCDYIVYKISVEYTKELQGPWASEVTVALRNKIEFCC